jgi:putative CRISPR-associated protein (TIGR02620 family)
VLNVPEHWRGKELTVEQMIECSACLEGYALKKINCVQE